ncbi:tetratricopeptide repeat-containing sensor histidine kinase [Algoriphagus winogradskyi]|uniref:Tetratricopeptide repeat-containing protein n=1 Tax=Algoriphagus winogradskyi TaxID=237017 RepID=A0ABY1P336_9BACT|nr:histidine kinase [Algoriphagus winogradskyi]SMP25229.1 Tetratricopeptide repeat-containing protein [Algoriphagus winogradskyi]
MGFYLVLVFFLDFFLLVDQDTLALDIHQLSQKDSILIDQRNDYLKKNLFSITADSSLLDMALQTLSAAEILGYQKGVLMADERLGLIYQYTFSNPFKALDYYLQALNLAESHAHLNEYQWGIKGNIATIYYEQEEFKKALDFFREVSDNSAAAELTAILNIGNIYGSLEIYDSAIFYFSKGLEHAQINTNPTQQANLYSNLSLIYSQAGQPEQAITTAEKSLKLVDSLEIDFVKPTAYANAAMAYLGTGDLEKAAALAQESLEYSLIQGNLFIQKSAWGTLSDIYAAEGNFKEALDAYRSFSTLKDSLNNQNRRVEINRKQMAFDFEKERTQAAAEIEKQKLVRKYTLWTGILILTGLLIASYFYMRRRDALTAKKEADFKALVSETELKALRSQMNPHFIFNSLNSIGDYILKNDADAAQDYLSKFGKLMRMVLENSALNEIQLSDDIRFLELYLQVESKRQAGKFTYQINISEDLEPGNILVPPMILQPFIENCIWHAFLGMQEKGLIEINFKKEKDKLLCSVQDNGVGRNNKNSDTEKKSMGVSITESRIKILREQSGFQGELRIIDNTSASGTRVEIILPLHLAF